jgi:hypothetical protein
LIYDQKRKGTRDEYKTLEEKALKAEKIHLKDRAEDNIKEILRRTGCKNGRFLYTLKYFLLIRNKLCVIYNRIGRYMFSVVKIVALNDLIT